MGGIDLTYDGPPTPAGPDARLEVEALAALAAGLVAAGHVTPVTAADELASAPFVRQFLLDLARFLEARRDPGR